MLFLALGKVVWDDIPPILQIQNEEYHHRQGSSNTNQRPKGVDVDAG